MATYFSVNMQKQSVGKWKSFINGVGKPNIYIGGGQGKEAAPLPHIMYEN